MDDRGVAVDDLVAHLLRDPAHRLEVVPGRDREPGLDDVHAQLRQLPGDVQLLLAGEGGPGALLPVRGRPPSRTRWTGIQGSVGGDAGGDHAGQPGAQRRVAGAGGGAPTPAEVLGLAGRARVSPQREEKTVPPPAEPVSQAAGSFRFALASTYSNSRTAMSTLGTAASIERV